jgi:hypothetical protein
LVHVFGFQASGSIDGARGFKAPDLDVLLMPFGSAEVDAEVLYVAGDDEDAFGPAPPAAAAEAEHHCAQGRLAIRH